MSRGMDGRAGAGALSRTGALSFRVAARVLSLRGVVYGPGSGPISTTLSFVTLILPPVNENEPT